MKHLKVRDRTGNDYNVGFGAVVLAGVSIFLAVTIWKLALHEFLHKKHGKTPSALLASGLKRYSLPGSQLSLQLPGEPQKENVDSPASGALVRQLHLYRYAVEGFQVAIWDGQYIERLPNDLQQTADGVIRALRDLAGVTEWQNSVTPIIRSGRSGLLIIGTFKRDSLNIELEAVLLRDESKLWQVIVTHPASSGSAHAASQRILDSIDINSTQIGPSRSHRRPTEMRPDWEGFWAA